MPPPASDGTPGVGKVVAPRVVVDLGRAAELAHPDDRGRCEQAARVQFGQQRSPGRVEHGAQVFDAVEIVGVRVPSNGIDAAERDFHKRYALFDQSPREQATLAEAIASVRRADVVGLLVEIKNLGRLAAHQLDGPLVGGLVAEGRRSGMIADKAIVEPMEQAQAFLDGIAGDAFRRSQVADRQAVVVGTITVAAIVAVVVACFADEQRGVLRSEKPGAERRRVEVAKRSDAHKARQLGQRIAQLLRHQRTERGIADRRLRQIAVAQQVRGPAVIPFLGSHRADDGQMLGLRGQLGQVLGNPQPRDAGFDGLETAAVFVPGLQVEGIQLAGAAAHPQQNARAAAVGRRRDAVGRAGQPGPGRAADQTGRGQTQHVASRKLPVRRTHRAAHDRIPSINDSRRTRPNSTKPKTHRPAPAGDCVRPRRRRRRPPTATIHRRLVAARAWPYKALRLRSVVDRNGASATAASVSLSLRSVAWLTSLPFINVKACRMEVSASVRGTLCSENRLRNSAAAFARSGNT